MIETTMHYKGSVELQFNTGKHHYTVDGETVHGVTSVLGIKAKPALVYWSANQAAKFIEDNLKVNTPVDEVEKMRLVEGAKKAHRNFLTDAAGIGTLFHNWVEDYINKKNPPMPTNPMLKKAVENFTTWVKANKVEFKSTERKVYSKKYGYCGTCDFTAVVNGKNVVGDLKTSSGIWGEQWLQVAAYKHALQEEFPEFSIDHTLILRCGKDGSFEVKEMNNYKENFAAFLGALELFKWDKQLKHLKFINS